MRDLIDKQVDVVVVGQATASYYGSRQDLKVVGKGFDQQNLAIAMWSEMPRLKEEIDRVMDDMLTDGTILSFIQQYIQSDVGGIFSTPIPPVTAIPSATTVVPPVCLNGMKFVADVTYGDNNMKNLPFVTPEEGFVKI